MTAIPSVLTYTPAVFAEQPAPHLLGRPYAFMPTTEVLARIEEHGWHPVYASQVRARKPENQYYRRHLVRLQNRDVTQAYKSGDYLPELVLVNSHDRTSAFHLWIGIFRVVCSNGLIVMDSTFGRLSIPHRAKIHKELFPAIDTLLNRLPTLTQRVKDYKAIELSPEKQLNLASRALALRYPKTAPIEPAALLHRRRPGDQGNDLWTVFNVVQENLLRGGVAGKAATGRQLTIRPIRSVAANVHLNTQLWAAMEDFAKAA